MAHPVVKVTVNDSFGVKNRKARHRLSRVRRDCFRPDSNVVSSVLFQQDGV